MLLNEFRLKVEVVWLLACRSCGASLRVLRVKGTLQHSRYCSKTEQSKIFCCEKNLTSWQVSIVPASRLFTFWAILGMTHGGSQQIQVTEEVISIRQLWSHSFDLKCVSLWVYAGRQDSRRVWRSFWTVLAIQGNLQCMFSSSASTVCYTNRWSVICILDPECDSERSLRSNTCSDTR